MEIGFVWSGMISSALRCLKENDSLFSCRLSCRCSWWACIDIERFVVETESVRFSDGEGVDHVGAKGSALVLRWEHLVPDPLIPSLEQLRMRPIWVCRFASCHVNHCERHLTALDLK